MVNLLPFFIGLWNSKTKAKPSGLPRQQLHFLCSDKENEAERRLGAALGMSGVVKAATSIQVILTD